MYLEEMNPGDQTCTEREIKLATNNLSQLWHPDEPPKK